MTQIIKPWCDVIVQLMARTYTQILAFSDHHQEHAQKQILAMHGKTKSLQAILPDLKHLDRQNGDLFGEVRICS